MTLQDLQILYYESVNIITNFKTIDWRLIGSFLQYLCNNVYNFVDFEFNNKYLQSPFTQSP